MVKLPPHLTITVNPDGKVSTDFLNFTGQACQIAGGQLHALLAEFGIETEVTTWTPKPELSGAMERMVVFQAETLQEGACSHDNAPA